MALKLVTAQVSQPACFGSIRNNMALKRDFINDYDGEGFGSIRNNMALKHEISLPYPNECFGSIRNNMALKP